MPEKVVTLLVEVVNICGHCPVYRVGDQFTIRKGHQLVADKAVCMHALQALSPYYVPLSRGLRPAELGLSGPNGAAYIQCLDPQNYTGGGTVTFRITPDGNSTDPRYTVKYRY